MTPEPVLNGPPKRSSGALDRRRVPLTWPEDRPFRILSIDGGGIRGVFPAVFLAELERRYLGGKSVAHYFDLIAGTSTGGILALGFGAGITAAELRDLYVHRGCEIFPPIRPRVLEGVIRRFQSACQLLKYRYDGKALKGILEETLGDRKFGESGKRLCIPSFDGRYGEVYIFKTPHHPDFRKDARESMTKVAEATSAAPTFFRPLEDGGYTFVDGGVWANNPIMIGLLDALTCFAVRAEHVVILSLGCGDDHYIVDRGKIVGGGIWAWRDVIFAAMRLQSQNAVGQAGLLLGADRIVRIDAPIRGAKMEMDDWRRAVDELPGAAEAAIEKVGSEVAARFLHEPAMPYEPISEAIS